MSKPAQDDKRTPVTGSSSLSAGHGGFAGGDLPRVADDVDFRALRELFTIAQVLALTSWRPVAKSGAQLRGPCPIHNSSSERSRSFSVNLELNVFQCFGCGKKGNHLDLWSALSGLALREAAIDVSQRLGIDLPPVSKRNREES